MKRLPKTRRGKIFFIASVLLAVANFVIFRASPEAKFISGFIALVLHFGSVALLGVLLGKGLAFIFRKYVTNIKATTNALRLGLWLPVIAMWAVWDVFFVSPLGILAVTLAACYYDLLSRSMLFPDAQQFKLVVTAEVVLHALLITLMMQVLESGFGWFAAYESHGLLKATITLIFILVTLYLVSTKMEYDFAVTSKVHSKIAEDLVSNNSRLSVRISVIIAAVVAIVWQALSMLTVDTWISSPWNVLKMAISDFSSGSRLWSDIATSVGEICLGLLICVVIIPYLCEFLLTRITMQSFVSKILYFTYIAPIVFVPWLFWWGILRGFWLATACVALLSFFPFFRVFSGLSSRSAKLKVLLACLEALPYAFVGMLFSESMNSFGGLGFALTPVRAESRGGAAESIALLLIVCFILSLTSWLLRCLARAEKRGRGSGVYHRNLAGSGSDGLIPY